MKPIKHSNQVHPPLPKKKRVDDLGNSRKRLWFKHSTSTMLFCQGLTENGCKALISHIENTAKQLGTTIEGNFIITQ